jgi:hypothetical protein
MMMNDYKNLTAESASSRFASVSAEESFPYGNLSEKQTGTLKWGQRELVQMNQFGYGEVDVYVVPVVGKINKDKIRKALDKKFPRQPSYGQLRWFSGHAVLDEGDLGFKQTDKKNSVTVEMHYGIAD